MLQHRVFTANVLNLELQTLFIKGRHWMRWCDLLTLLQYKHNKSPYSNRYSKGSGSNIPTMAKYTNTVAWVKNYTVTFDKFGDARTKSERSYMDVELVYNMCKKISIGGQHFTKTRVARAKLLLAEIAILQRKLSSPGYQQTHELQSLVTLKGGEAATAPPRDFAHRDGTKHCYMPIGAVAYVDSMSRTIPEMLITLIDHITIYRSRVLIADGKTRKATHELGIANQKLAMVKAHWDGTKAIRAML